MGLAESWTPDPEVPEEPSVLALEGSPTRGTAGAGGFPRAADVVVAGLLLLISSPLLIVGALVVLAGGGFPIFFGHERVGRKGIPFRCWKLRTMRSDAEERLWADADLHRRYVENGFKLPTARDPRLLTGGGWLRRLYLDELPQLWNVLNGTMSLVGPRPVVARELVLFGDDQEALLQCRPGVFGEWTSRGRRRPPYPERVRVEMAYVNDPSLSRSVRILARSVSVLLRGQGEEG